MRSIIQKNKHFQGAMALIIIAAIGASLGSSLFRRGNAPYHANGKSHCAHIQKPNNGYCTPTYPDKITSSPKENQIPDRLLEDFSEVLIYASVVAVTLYIINSSHEPKVHSPTFPPASDPEGDKQPLTIGAFPLKQPPVQQKTTNQITSVSHQVLKPWNPHVDFIEAQIFSEEFSALADDLYTLQNLLSYAEEDFLRKLAKQPDNEYQTFMMFYNVGRWKKREWQKTKRQLVEIEPMLGYIKRITEDDTRETTIKFLLPQTMLRRYETFFKRAKEELGYVTKFLLLKAQNTEFDDKDIQTLMKQQELMQPQLKVLNGILTEIKEMFCNNSVKSLLKENDRAHQFQLNVLIKISEQLDLFKTKSPSNQSHESPLVNKVETSLQATKKMLIDKKNLDALVHFVSTLVIYKVNLQLRQTLSELLKTIKKDQEILGKQEEKRIAELKDKNVTCHNIDLNNRDSLARYNSNEKYTPKKNADVWLLTPEDLNANNSA